MPSFGVGTYKVSLNLMRVGANPVVTHRRRLIEIAGIPDSAGVAERAVLDFSTYWDNWSTPAVVGFHNTSNAMQPVLYGWLPSSEYALWYDVLRSEQPLFIFFDITQIGGSDYVSRIALGTSTESIGEGPREFGDVN